MIDCDNSVAERRGEKWRDLLHDFFAPQSSTDEKSRPRAVKWPGDVAKNDELGNLATLKSATSRRSLDGREPPI